MADMEYSPHYSIIHIMYCCAAQKSVEVEEGVDLTPTSERNTRPEKMFVNRMRLSIKCTHSMKCRADDGYCLPLD